MDVPHEASVSPTPENLSEFIVGKEVSNPRFASIRDLPLNILLAEDSAVIQKYIEHLLTAAGHRVQIVSNGREALQALERMRFDLILMDVQMPEMDGIEATQTIRNSQGEPIDPAVPIVALTAYAMKGDRERMLAYGMDAYVPKPVDADELFQAISEVLQRKGRTPGGGTCPGKSMEPVDLEDMKTRCSQSVVFENWLKKTIPIFLEETSRNVDLLEKALAAGDFDAAAKIAHGLAGTAGVIKAARTLEYARSLEVAARNRDIEKVPILFVELDAELREVMRILSDYFSTSLE